MTSAFFGERENLCSSALLRSTEKNNRGRAENPGWSSRGGQRSVYIQGETLSVDSAKVAQRGKTDHSPHPYPVYPFSCAQTQLYRGALCVSGSA